ncbi:hypothetical protein ACFVUP_38945 [Streptomyces bacillaris]|uniref:hypothetical protein n=1 Tax=Streptomyces bacillaris TaxID=68179 RepID=UPI0036D8F73B
MTTSNKDDRAAESELADWLLTQRILADVGALEAGKVAYLDQQAPGWNLPITDDEFGHALASTDQELGFAMETWWNLSKMSPEPMTIEEIRAKAYSEM